MRYVLLIPASYFQQDGTKSDGQGVEINDGNGLVFKADHQLNKSGNQNKNNLKANTVEPGSKTLASWQRGCRKFSKKLTEIRKTWGYYKIYINHLKNIQSKHYTSIQKIRKMLTSLILAAEKLRKFCYRAVEEQNAKNVNVGGEKSIGARNGDEHIGHARTHKLNADAIKTMGLKVDKSDDKKENDVSKMCQL